MKNFKRNAMAAVLAIIILGGFQNCSSYDVPESVKNGQGSLQLPPQSVQNCAVSLNYTQAGCPAMGKAGVKVSLVDLPADAAQKTKSCVYSLGWFGTSGNGFYVEWGDGSISPVYNDSVQGQSCSDVVKSHTYFIPGVYPVHIRSWHPGPTDIPVTDWEQTIQVVIN